MQPMQVKTWSEYKILLQQKALLVQYSETVETYDLVAPEMSELLWLYTLSRDGGPDVVDFETNYKPTANAPVFIGEDIVVNAFALRDTSNHFSIVSDNRGAIPKTILIQNELNQPVVLQLEGDREPTFANVVAVGSSFTVAPVTDSYATISDYLPYLRLRYSSAVAPVSGALSVFMEKVRA